MVFLTLVSIDNQMFEIDIENLKISNFLFHIYDLDKTNKLIHINTNGNFLDLIVKFLKFYHKNPYISLQSPIPKNFNNALFIFNDKVFKEEFYINLLQNLEINKCIELLKIVNYLGISPLNELLCSKIANLIRD
jgi:hypothetical protein